MLGTVLRSAPRSRWWQGAEAVSGTLVKHREVATDERTEACDSRLLLPPLLPSCTDRCSPAGARADGGGPGGWRGTSGDKHDTGEQEDADHLGARTLGRMSDLVADDGHLRSGHALTGPVLLPDDGSRWSRRWPSQASAAPQERLRQLAGRRTSLRHAAVATTAIAVPVGAGVRAAAAFDLGAGAAGLARHSRQAAAASLAHPHPRACQGRCRGRAPHPPTALEGAAPARLAAWCIGRAPRQGRPGPHQTGGSNGAGRPLPFYLARRIPSIPVVARHSSSVGDEARRDQGESWRPTTGGSHGRRASDPTAAGRRAPGERSDAGAVAPGRLRTGVHSGRPVAPLPALRCRRVA
jgi:hypothetical protein